MGQNQAKGQYASVGMVENNDDNNNDEKPESDLTFVFHNDELQGCALSKLSYVRVFRDVSSWSQGSA